MYVTPKESMQYNIKFACFPNSKLFINSVWAHIDFILNINNLFFNFWQNNCKNSGGEVAEIMPPGDSTIDFTLARPRPILAVL